MGKRDLSIDFLRGIAIVLMTITHVNALLYTGDNTLLHTLTTLGVNICFPIFLFCSAYVIGLKSQKSDSINFKDTLRRILEIYIVYVILGLFITFVLTNSITLTNVLNLVSLNLVPDFTEFLIAFIFFSLISSIFFKQIKYLIQNPFLFVAITLLIYILGVVIHPYISANTYPNIVRILFENVFGYGSLHRFPLTFYLPIFTFGILLSKYKTRDNLIKILIISFLLFFFLYLTKLSHWNRWPPSPLFLMYGYIYIPLILLLYDCFEKLLSKKFFTLVTRMGQYPLEQFFLSTFLIFLSRLFIQPGSSELLPVVFNVVILGALLLHPIVFHRKMV